MKQKIENISLPYTRSIVSIIAVFAVVGIGTYLITSGHASAPYSSIAADEGSLMGGANQMTCSQASDGNCVQFGLNSTAYSLSVSPDGPSAPSGGWTLAYGDAFAEPLCTAASQSNCDNTLYPNRSGSCNNAQGFNPDEYEVFNCSAVSVDSNGLHLSCTYTPGVTAAGSPTQNSNYTCGSVNGAVGLSGYKFFGFTPGEGQTWAVQTVAQFPPDTGEADPGWWAHGGNYNEEIDFFEGFGLGGGPGGGWETINKTGLGCTTPLEQTYDSCSANFTDPTWIYNEGQSGQGQLEGEQNFLHDLNFDPSAAYHTYTTFFYPDGSYSEYIDGVQQSWSYAPGSCLGGASTCTQSIAPPVNNAQSLQLILSYGMREDSDSPQSTYSVTNAVTDPYFTSGTRDFNIRSIAVYENTTANGADTVNPGIAPGTTVK